jgi:uncharacterized membrane protein
MKKTWMLVTKKQGMGILAGLLGALSGSALAAQTPSWTFTTVDFPGFASVTSPLAINNRGDIVGYYDDSAGAIHGYLRPNGGAFIPVDFPGAVATMAFTINDTGEIVGVYFDQNGFQHGFLLRRGVFSTIDFPGAAQTRGVTFELGPGLGTAAYGLNRHGDVVGDYADSNEVAHGFLLRHGQFSSFDAPGAQQSPGTETLPAQINSFGDIVGGFRRAEFHDSHGFLLQDGQFTIIDEPEAAGVFGTIATGINDDGDIVGSFSGPTNNAYDFHGFALIQGQYIRIDVLGAFYTETYRINNNQDIVGGYADQARRVHGYIGFRNP